MRQLRIEETKKEQLKNGTLDAAQDRILTPEEIQEKNNQAMAQGILEVWEMMKTDETTERYAPIIFGMGHLYYDYLRNNGIMDKPDPESQKEIRKLAAELMENEIKLRQHNATRTEIKTLNAALKDVTKNVNFKNMCKKIAVRRYLADLVLAEVDLQELIIKAATK